MYAIKVNSNFKKEALKFLQLLNVDPKLRDMLGIDFTHYSNDINYLNNTAIKSVVFNFTMDVEPVIYELNNCRNIWNKYKNDLITGASNPDYIIPKLNTELKQAGIYKIKKEAQKQINEWKLLN
jgi:putative aldouronate transport system substrate-binding protein